MLAVWRDVAKNFETRMAYAYQQILMENKVVHQA